MATNKDLAELFTGVQAKATFDGFLEILFHPCPTLCTEAFIDRQPSFTLPVYYGGVLGLSADCLNSCSLSSTTILFYCHVSQIVAYALFILTCVYLRAISTHPFYRASLFSTVTLCIANAPEGVLWVAYTTGRLYHSFVLGLIFNTAYQLILLNDRSDSNPFSHRIPRPLSLQTFLAYYYLQIV
jgi:hypothetical protein